MIVEFFTTDEEEYNSTIVECKNINVHMHGNGAISVITYPNLTNIEGVERQVYDTKELPYEEGKPPFNNCFVYNDNGLLIKTISHGIVKDGK